MSVDSSALLSSLIMDKLNKVSTGTKRKRRSSSKGGKKKKTDSKKKRWTMKKLANGLYEKQPKKGWMVTPAGRYVRDTTANREKYADNDEDPAGRFPADGGILPMNV